MIKGEWARYAVAGAELACRVTPKAGRDALDHDGERFVIRVTAVPDGGKANKAVLKLLAKGLGVPVSRLVLIRGQTSRDKVIRVD